jgi:N-acyl-D-amino-acid deacylase
MSAIDRRSFLGLAGLTAAACAAPRTAQTSSAPAFDCVLRGGRVLDGTGGAETSADIGIRGDTIAAIGRIDADQARTVIDARGLCVSPGFIDIHTHSDGDVLHYPDDESRIYQGITTEVTGNCGGSAAPVSEEHAAALAQELADDGITERWTDVASYFRALQSRRIATNQVLLLGQGTLRRAVVGLQNRPLSGDELARVVRLLEDGLEQGAAGLSSGLEYTPGRFTPTDELIALARVVARRGKLYASHIRNEEAQLLESIEEALRVGRDSGVRVEISHLKAAGRPNWPKLGAAIAAIEQARRSGLDVLADVYPYTAYSTGLTIFLSDAVREGGSAAILQRLADPAQRRQIRADLLPRIASDPGGFELIVIAATAAEQKSDVVGKDLAAIATARGVDPAEALLQLLEEGRTSVSFIGHAMAEADVVRVLVHPLVMIGSDGYAVAPRGRALERRPHPRSYGTFARVLGKYVRQERHLDLATAVHKMSGMPAAQLRLSDRGRIAEGMKADLVVFDSATVKEEASFEDPHHLASGFAHVLVNGVAVIADGKATGARPGSVLS